MPTKVVPYLFFKGNAAEALDFYVHAGLGQPHRLSHYKDGPPMPGTPEGWENKLMHGEIVGEHVTIMVSDSAQAQAPGGFAMSIGLEDRAEADRLFAALSDGGQVRMPLANTFWGAYFGMFTDKFGVPWMINCEPAGAGQHAA